MGVFRIAAINLGSTSTKFAYYENDVCKAKANLPHSAEEIRAFQTVWDQIDYRLEAIVNCMAEHGIEVSSLDAVVTRGGHTVPLEGGVYHINEEMLRQSRSEQYGNHASDLGLPIACRLAGDHALALTVDPPVTDEFSPLARYSGLPELPRKSKFHALNHRAVAKRYAKQKGVSYGDLCLVSAHMGGGITVAAHQNGRMVDANDGLSGDGPFSTNRTGSVPESALVELCFSGRFTKQEILRKLIGNGGMMAYLGENDVLTVERRAQEGEEKCREVLEAMCYQTAKEIAAMASVLKGRVDAILLTGGIAYSEYITGLIQERVSFIAPVVLIPGEYEMESLALGALGALTGEEPVKQL